MSTLRERLLEDDPLVGEPRLADADIERMRRAVLAATSAEPTRTRIPWLALAVTTAGVAAGVVMTRQPTDGHEVIRPTDVAASRRASDDIPDLRQLQFATPGGTRVIWTFNPNFEMR